MARFLADENFPLPVVEELRQLGHDVVTIADIGRTGQSLPDEAILLLATADVRTLLTLSVANSQSGTACEQNELAMLFPRWVPRGTRTRPAYRSTCRHSHLPSACVARTPHAAIVEKPDGQIAHEPLS